MAKEIVFHGCQIDVHHVPTPQGVTKVLKIIDNPHGEVFSIPLAPLDAAVLIRKLSQGSTLELEENAQGNGGIET